MPLTITANLTSPPVVDRPVYLDGLILAGLGAEMGARHASGWVDETLVLAEPLPLARIESEYGWWYAASHIVPSGPEAVGHLNRVPLVEEAGRWTGQRSLNQQAGPDKRLRIPYYARSGMLRLTWTCVGDPLRIGELLARVSSVGRLAGHGHGWVERWTVALGGPPLEAYAADLRLRHLPAELRVPMPPAVARRQLPLRPPYHRRRDAVPCWQVQS